MIAWYHGRLYAKIGSRRGAEGAKIAEKTFVELFLCVLGALRASA